MSPLVLRASQTTMALLYARNITSNLPNFDVTFSLRSNRNIILSNDILPQLHKYMVHGTQLEKYTLTHLTLDWDTNLHKGFVTNRHDDHARSMHALVNGYLSKSVFNKRYSSRLQLRVFNSDHNSVHTCSLCCQGFNCILNPSVILSVHMQRQQQPLKMEIVSMMGTKPCKLKMAAATGPYADMLVAILIVSRILGKRFFTSPKLLIRANKSSLVLTD